MGEWTKSLGPKSGPLVVDAFKCAKKIEREIGGKKIQEARSKIQCVTLFFLRYLSRYYTTTRSNLDSFALTRFHF